MGLIVKSEVGDMISKKGMRTSGALYDELDKKVAEILGAACARAKANDRMTVMAQDI